MGGENRRKYISYRVDTHLQEKFVQGGAARGKKPTRELCTESCWRCLSLLRFLLFCSASLVQALAPWMLSAIETLVVLLVYFLCVSRSPLLRYWYSDPAAVSNHHFRYRHSVEDIVGLACARAGLLSIAYAFGMRLGHRPYLYASYLLAIACFPYIIVKTILFRYTSDAVPAASLFAVTGIFCWLHVLAGRRTVEWARRRYQMGLGVFGYPWDEGEDAWQLLRRPDLEEMTKCSDGGAPEDGEDVPPESLADDDSKFVQLGSMRVHYKEAVPPGCAAGQRGSTGIVLVHGFGGGVFAWRHIMADLAAHCQCRVVALDRPAFGLTSRPKVMHAADNPYTVGAQAQLMLQLCAALGLQRVVVVAHADGCLVALRAAAIAASHLDEGTRLQPPLAAMSSSFSGSHGLPPLPPHPAFCSRVEQHRAGTAPVSAEATPRAFASPALSSSNSLHAELMNAHVHASQQQQHAYGNAQQHVVGYTRAQASSVSQSATHAVAAGHQQQLQHHGQQAGASAYPHLPAVQLVGAVMQSSADGSTRGRDSFTSAASVGPDGYDVSARSSLNGLGHGTADSSLGRAFSAGSAEGEVGSVRDNMADLDASGSLVGSLRMEVAGGGTPPPIQGLYGGNHHRRRSAGAEDSSLGYSQPGTSSSPITRMNITRVAINVQHLLQGSGMPQVLGVVLLHPNLSGQIGPSFSRLLARSKLGRSILRPLLRSEIGEVANRRSWHDSLKLTAEVLELYKAPLRVEGWDHSLIETTRLPREFSQAELTSSFAGLRPVPPALVVTGEHDRIFPPSKAESLTCEIPRSRSTILSDCGHLSHEEAPEVLLTQLVPFCTELLALHSRTPSAQHQQHQMYYPGTPSGLVDLVSRDV